MRAVRLLLVVLAGCSFQPGVLPPSDGGEDAPAVDAKVVEPDAFDPRCFGKSPFTICIDPLPTEPVTLPQGVNTSSTGDPSCESIGGVVRTVTGVEACVIAGTTITAAGSIVGTYGERPLVLVATDSIEVTTSNFDITSRTRPPASDGPNANAPQCSDATTQHGESSNGGGGGGAGGSFGSRGSNGGMGSSSGGVAAQPETTFDVLRGGCPGGAGGRGAGPSAAQGGSGGGAIYLVARNKISISGTINASGAGGHGGIGARGGGGGGGSGGMIVLHAATLDIAPTARIFANGGGGGGGAGNSTNNGGRGADALEVDEPAAGGSPGDIQGAEGGTGAYRNIAAGGVQPAAQGGGGGGGGVGVIRVLSGQSIPAANVSPTPILN